ncbi:unnamed protein product [Prunus brigantina]
MLRIRDHKQKLVDLHNLTTSRGLIGTQASLRRPPRCPRRARGGKGQREAPFLNNSMRASLEWGAKPRPRHDMPRQGKTRHDKLRHAKAEATTCQRKARPRHDKLRHAKAEATTCQRKARPRHDKLRHAKAEAATCQRKASHAMPSFQ